MKLKMSIWSCLVVGSSVSICGLVYLSTGKTTVMKAPLPRFDPRTLRLKVQRSNHSAVASLVIASDNSTVNVLRQPPTPAGFVSHQKETLADYVWRQCQHKHMVSSSPKPRSLGHLLVDDKNKVLFCYIPKVACSNWRRVLLVLRGRVSAADMMKISVHSHPALGWLPSLSSYDLTAVRYRLRHYFKFVFVRDPLERLLSAWRNKFQSNKSTSVAFRGAYVHRIVQRYRDVSNRNSLGRRASGRLMIGFDEFLRYVVDRSAGVMNEHWERFHRLCLPCAVHYDFVGKYETMEEDAGHVLQLLNASHKVSFPKRSASYLHKPTSVFVSQYYRNLSASLLKRVAESYDVDFDLFNYSVPEYTNK
ncbi:carbohydrate sulfotransferase 11-like [Babylonia areolata]|uniref:carbohydrate sulfotransferase 11-like n=1 Tax=Babylonia areolata TaxID=304850 RepID=UPI003FD3AF2F